MILLDQGGAGRNCVTVTAPPADVEQFVEHGFTQVGGWRCAPDAWRVIPEAHATIIVTSKIRAGSERLSAAIVGPRAKFGDIDVRGRTLLCGVRLRVGALPSITGLPASDFTDRSVPLSLVSGRPARLLAQWLDDEPPAADLVDALFAFVAAAVRGRERRHNVVPLDGFSSARALAACLGVSPRTAYHRVLTNVGLSPRRFLRVERLERALRAHAAGDAWSRAALVGGYADQPHFIRETRALLGETPGAWSRRAAVAESFNTPRA